MAFHLKLGDLRPYLALQLVDAAGAAVNLTGATDVELKWTEPDGTARVEDMAVTTVAEGRVSYAWQAGDTAKVGRHSAEVVVTWPTAEPQSFPPQGYFSWFVHPVDGITWRDVVGIASELDAVDDEAQFDILAMVNAAFKTSTFDSTKLRLARLYLAAHHGTFADPARGANAPTGALTHETLGPASFSYASVSSDSQRELETTSYGQALAYLLRTHTTRGAYVL